MTRLRTTRKGAIESTTAAQDTILAAIHDKGAERLLLGCILRDANALDYAAKRIAASAIYRDSYRKIYEVALDLLQRDYPVNVLTVGEELHRNGALADVGGGLELARLDDELHAINGDDTSPSMVSYAAQRVLEAYHKRQASNLLRAAETRIRTNGFSVDSLQADLRRDLEDLGLLATPAEQDLTVPADAFLVDPPPLEWDIERIRVQGDHGWTGGAPKSMKGFLSLEEARANSTGTPFLGYFPTRKRRVLWVSEEDRQPRLHRRFHNMVRGRPPEEIPGPEDLRFLIKKGVRLDTDPGRSILRRHLELHRPDIVILEHFDKMHSRNVIKPEEMKPVLDELDAFHGQYGCIFRVQKHFRKQQAGQGRRTGEMLSGAQGLFGWGESSIYLTLIKRGQAMVECEAKDGDVTNRFLVEYRDGRIVYAGEAGAEGKATRREQAIARVLEAVKQQPGASVEELADTLKLSDKTVRRHLKSLERSKDVLGQQESSKHPRRFWPKPIEQQG